MRNPCAIYQMFDYNKTNPGGSPEAYWLCGTHNIRLQQTPQQTNFCPPHKCEHGAIEDIVDARFEQLEQRIKALEDKQK